MSERYTLTNLLRVLKNPSTILGELSLLALRINRHASATDGELFMSRDWDVLVLLDGCRFDSFKDRNYMDGELTSVTSLGSHSTEFIQRNFVGKQYHDTVYVSANPHVELLKGKEVFHDIIDVFDWGWNEELRTVLPETMAEATIEAAEKYPNKRIISHFMQPHTPFIGKTGRQISHAGITGEGAGRADANSSSQLSLWMRLRYRLASENMQTIRKAYEENLDLALPHVQEIRDSVTGKVVVSADHGNMLGERMHPLPVKMWGHPPGIDHPVLREVPWLEMPYKSRRETVSDSPAERTKKMDDSDVEERLRALGYT
ncbi:hypothetical protein [Natrinema sp. HArc-T2]|uniref:hypothetical protein n=1 Tax=Natrinema sp. HArc-T2 TaxID=3242701 RepID=UPI00359D0088